MNSKTLLILINLGTPDSSKKKDVKNFLSQFLNDPRVIDIPWLLRKFLVNCIIVPFRTKNSSKIYSKIWHSTEGSPLLKHTIELTQKLEHQLKLQNIDVTYAMRYQNPSMTSVLQEIKNKNYQKIIVFPMFPHYASSSTGSALEEFMRIVSKWWVIPELKIISQYFNQPEFINCIVNRTSEFPIHTYDHIVFSYHGLPISQVDKVYPNNDLCANHHCEHTYDNDNAFCYKAACFETSKLLIENLKIDPSKTTTSFQSRLTKKWIEPFSDEVIINLAKNGAKKILVFSPAFTADCLETLYEIEIEYLEIFKHHGGQELHMVKSLNSENDWVKAIETIALK